MIDTTLIIVDTARYDELLAMSRLLEFPHRWYGNHWAVAPFTLPAMASMLSGLLPEEHGLWNHWDQPKRCRELSCVRDTVASDFGKNALAFTGAGFADGPAYGYAPDFRAWNATVGGELQIQNYDKQSCSFLLLHTYELHHYVSINNLHDRINHENGCHPYEMYYARNHEKLGWIQDRLCVYIRKCMSERRIFVTSDHGECFSPGHALGHGAGTVPSAELLHIPLIEFGVGVEPGVEHRLVPQNRLRQLLSRGEISEEPVDVVWRYDEHGKPFYRKYRLSRFGMTGIETEERWAL